jgi:signal transduction histidine kinase
MSKPIVDIVLALFDAAVTGAAYTAIFARHKSRRVALIFVAGVTFIYETAEYILRLEQTYSTVLQIAAGFAMQLFLTRGRYLKKTVFIFLSFICMLGGDAVATFVVSHSYEGDIYALMERMDVTIVANTVFLIVKIILLLILVLSWRRFLDRSDNGYFWKFMVFPISQLFLYFALYYISIFKIERLDTVAGVMLLSVIVCVIADVFLFYAIRQLNDRHIIEKKRIMAESQLQSQLDYYNRLYAGIHSAQKLRHDFNNQLTAITLLVSRGETDAALLQLSELGAILPGSGPEKFCDNMIVNAVLTSKRAAIDRHGIAFSAELDVPGDITVEGVELCGLFANLLDNAIEACAKVDGERKISLTSAVRYGRLIIRMENSKPAADAPNSRDFRTTKANAEEHGFGMEIIREIVAKHSGEVRTEESGELFRLTADLLL